MNEKGHENSDVVRVNFAVDYDRKLLNRMVSRVNRSAVELSLGSAILKALETGEVQGGLIRVLQAYGVAIRARDG